MSSITPQLDHQQNFQKIIIQTPFGQQITRNSTFQKAQKIIERELNEMIKSNFYKQINVHFGVKSLVQNQKSQIIYFQKKKNILNYKIQAQKKLLTNIANASNQQQLSNFQKQYSQNLLLIKERQQQISNFRLAYAPWIYIQAQKKWPVYGQIMQDFNRKGMGALQAKLGYRSVFDRYDRIQFNYESPLSDLKRKYYHIGFNWSNNIKKYGNLNIKAVYGRKNLYQDIDQKSKTLSVGLSTDKYKIQLQRVNRSPMLYNSLNSYIARDYHIPTIKYSLKSYYKLLDSIKRGDIITGQYSQLTTQIGIPYLSNHSFFKIQYNGRSYHDIFWISKYFQNDIMKNLFKNSNFQSNVSLNLLLNPKYCVSDLLENLDIRGFQPSKKPSRFFSNLKASLKFNIYNYPLIGSVGIVPFLFSQAGVAMKSEMSKFQCFLSTGFGISYNLGPNAQIEIIYSLFQSQLRKSREPVNFQIRIGVFD